MTGRSSRHLTVLLPVLLAACTTTRMATPPDLIGADVLDVSNRSGAAGTFVDESFNVGPYRVSKVDRGSHITTTSSVGGFTRERGRQGFGFRFIGEQTWQGRCDLNSRDTVLRSKQALFVADSHAQLDCRCTNGRQSVQLKLDDNWHPLQGDMMLCDGVHYGLRQEGFADGLRSRALGYRVEGADDHAVAAVEVQYPGRIWRQPNLPAEQREPQACLLGALMIYGLQPAYLAQ
jgi:hypothetical protein